MNATGDKVSGVTGSSVDEIGNGVGINGATVEGDIGDIVAAAGISVGDIIGSLVGEPSGDKVFTNGSVGVGVVAGCSGGRQGDKAR